MKILNEHEIVLQKGRTNDGLSVIGYFFFSLLVIVGACYLLFYFDVYNFEFIPSQSVDFIQNKLHIPVIEMYFLVVAIICLLLSLLFALLYSLFYNGNYLIITNQRVFINSKKGKKEFKIQELTSVSGTRNAINITKDEEIYKIKYLMSPHSNTLILAQLIEKAKKSEVIQAQ